MAEAGDFLEAFSDEEKEALAPLRFAAVVGRFYEDLANRLLQGADQGFELAGVSVPNVTHVSVPGAYELPMAAKTLIGSGESPGSPASASSSAARPTTTTSSAPRRPAGSRTSSWRPACPAPSG